MINHNIQGTFWINIVYSYVFFFFINYIVHCSKYSRISTYYDFLTVTLITFLLPATAKCNMNWWNNPRVGIHHVIRLANHWMRMVTYRLYCTFPNSACLGILRESFRKTVRQFLLLRYHLNMVTRQYTFL